MEAELMKCVQEENAAKVRELLQAPGINVNFEDENGGSPLNNACAFSLPVDIIQTMLALGADPNAPNNVGSTPLIHAVYAKASLDVVSTLLKAGADVSYKNKAGGTPLIVACICNNKPEIINALLKAGADPSARNSTGNSALMYAVRNNNPLETIKLLVDAGANINDKTFKAAKYSEFSALHFAAGEGRADVCSLLIKAGADLKQLNSEGNTALMLANQETKTVMMQTSFSLFAESKPAGSPQKTRPSIHQTGVSLPNPLLAREAQEGQIGVRKPAYSTFEENGFVYQGNDPNSTATAPYGLDQSQVIYEDDGSGASNYNQEYLDSNNNPYAYDPNMQQQYYGGYDPNQQYSQGGYVDPNLHQGASDMI